MNQLLDFTGVLLFVAFRMIVLPLVLVLYLLLVIILLVRYTKTGIDVLCRMLLKAYYSLTKYSYHLGRRINIWSWHR